MPRKDEPLDKQTAETLAGRLTLIADYPRNSEAREASGYQLQSICKGDDTLSPVEQATMLINEAVATIHPWCGWPAMHQLFKKLFRAEEPEYDIHAPPPGSCPECGTSGMQTRDGNLERCGACERGKYVTDEELERWNQPLPEFRPIVKAPAIPRGAIMLRPLTKPVTDKPFERVTEEDFKALELKLKGASKNGDGTE